MMILLVLIILICFLLPAFYGAPFVPTLPRYVKVALDLLDLKRGETMLELGCGSGAVVIAAAQRGYRVVGYEMNPVLALIAWLRTRRYGKQVTIVWGNFFTKQLPPAEGIFCFIMPKFMGTIDAKVRDSQLAPIKLVSFAMPIPDKQPSQRKNNVLLYLYN